MRNYIIAAVVMLIIIGSGLTFTSAQPTIPLQTTVPCPTYQTNLTVDIVNAEPQNVALGGTVVIKIHVIYDDGTPVTLAPEAASFKWVGPGGEMQFDQVSVQYTGEPGFYTYSQEITQALYDAVGEGTVNVLVVVCSCSDGRGNRGPTGNVDSDLTLPPSDNSKVIIGPGTTPPPPSPISSYLVPLLIAILLVIALLLFFLRSRRKKK